jgi:hypothetical protein
VCRTIQNDLANHLSPQCPFAAFGFQCSGVARRHFAWLRCLLLCNCIHSLIVCRFRQGGTRDVKTLKTVLGQFSQALEVKYRPCGRACLSAGLNPWSAAASDGCG